MEKPMRPVLTHVPDLKGLVNQMCYLGFFASTGEFYESNTIMRWNLSVEVLPDSNCTEGQNGKNPLKIGLAVEAPLLVLLVVGISGVVYYARNKIRARKSDPKLLSTIGRLPESSGFEN